MSLNKTLNKSFLACLMLFIFTLSAYSNELLILPKQNKEAVSKIESLILNSKNEIKIAVYNFSYKKFTKALLKAQKNGVNIIVYFDNKKVKEENDTYKLLKKNHIKTILIKDKLHTKLAIFDNKTAYFGSANWTKKSFKENYEILYFTKDKETLETLNNFLSNLN